MLFAARKSRENRSRRTNEIIEDRICSFNPIFQQPARKEIAGGKTAQEIANEANNPAAPVTLIQFRDILLPKASVAGVLPGVNGASGTVNSLQMQPVLPIGPFKLRIPGHGDQWFRGIMITIPG